MNLSRTFEPPVPFTDILKLVVFASGGGVAIPSFSGGSLTQVGVAHTGPDLTAQVVTEMVGFYT